MRVTVEATDRIVEVVTPEGSVPARVWQGANEEGQVVVLLVTRVATPADGDLAAFERDLRPVPPGEAALHAFPNRMVL